MPAPSDEALSSIDKERIRRSPQSARLRRAYVAGARRQARSSRGCESRDRGNAGPSARGRHASREAALADAMVDGPEWVVARAAHDLKPSMATRAPPEVQRAFAARAGPPTCRFRTRLAAARSSRNIR